MKQSCINYFFLLGVIVGNNCLLVSVDKYSLRNIQAWEDKNWLTVDRSYMFGNVLTGIISFFMKSIVFSFSGYKIAK